MRILTVNTGSTSVKLALYAGPGQALQQIWSEQYRDASSTALQILQRVRDVSVNSVDRVVHRIVHGGAQFRAPVQLDDATLRALHALTPLAPLHNPTALTWIEAARTVWPAPVLQIAAFDTAFFASLPRVAAEYALPPRIGTERGVRRYGFHGLAHESLWRRWCELRPELTAGGRLISLQLGGGCSMAAIEEGRPLDTTMGFSPLEGLVMDTRCGDLDAAVVPYLQAQLGLTASAVLELLESESGLAGLAGSQANAGVLASRDDSQARFALELYCYRIRKYLGAYLAVLGGCDGVVFGGGVGEHVPAVRAGAVQGLEIFGLALDRQRNAAATGGEAEIGAAGARAAVWAIPSNEETIMVRAASTLAEH